MADTRAAKFTVPGARRIVRAVRAVEGQVPSVNGQRPGFVPRQIPSPLFAVKVTPDGGSAGSLSTTCSFTYTVTNRAGTHTYGEGLTPSKRRLVNTPYTTTPDDSDGLAFFDCDGTFVLYDANETPFTVEDCETP